MCSSDLVRAFRKALEYTAAYPEEAWTISQKYVENLTEEVAPIQKEVLRESISHWQLIPETGMSKFWAGPI